MDKEDNVILIYIDSYRMLPDVPTRDIYHSELDGGRVGGWTVAELVKTGMYEKPQQAAASPDHEVKKEAK